MNQRPKGLREREKYPMRGATLKSIKNWEEI